jgi:dihydrofolate synthase/folylpolyglutamate synthase
MPLMSVADQIAELAREYPAGGRRTSLEAVAELRALLPLEPSPAAVGVVGTNGKTSTATYLARLLAAGGRRTGLYVSPHLADWGERVRVDDVPCDPRELLEALTAVRERARSVSCAPEDLRFFDLLTLAADLIFVRAGVEVGVFEAGIGGRLDAISTLRPQLLLLTSMALDHTEILGESTGEILREKLLAAPGGATVATLPLDGELDELAEAIASERGIRLIRVDPKGARGSPDLPAYLNLALALAEAGAAAAEEVLPPPPPSARPAAREPRAVDLRLPGRFECGMHRGIPYVLDIAHNEAAWRELALEASRRFAGPDRVPLTALISVSPGKLREGLPDALRSLPGFELAVATRHSALAAADPGAVAAELRRAGLEASAVEGVAPALAAAFERAARSAGRVIVFGSTHLVGEVRPLLSGGAEGG